MKALGTSVSPWTLEAELPEAEERNEETRARVQALSAGQPGPLALSPLLLILMSFRSVVCFSISHSSSFTLASYHTDKRLLAYGPLAVGCQSWVRSHAGSVDELRCLIPLCFSGISHDSMNHGPVIRTPSHQDSQSSCIDAHERWCLSSTSAKS